MARTFLSVCRLALVYMVMRLSMSMSSSLWVTLVTRLETRTKESNTRASHWVLRNLEGKVKVNVGYISVSHTAQNRPMQVLLCTVSRKSVRVGTRKMVNYAWISWSQGKLWWRTVAILTCKSIVKFEYRGERLIEPSSSWFPPKFPSG